MVGGMNKGKEGGEGQEGGGGRVKKGFPSSCGIYLPCSPSACFGRGPNSVFLCEPGRSEAAAFKRWAGGDVWLPEKLCTVAPATSGPINHACHTMAVIDAPVRSSWTSRSEARW